CSICKRLMTTSNSYCVTSGNVCCNRRMKPLTWPHWNYSRPRMPGKFVYNTENWPCAITQIAVDSQNASAIFNPLINDYGNATYENNHALAGLVQPFSCPARQRPAGDSAVSPYRYRHAAGYQHQSRRF